MLILYNNNPIIIHTNNIHLVRGNPVFRASIVSPGGNTHFSRILCLARGNTHIPRTSVLPEENTHFPRISRNHCVAAARFREPPELPAWHWETPYTTITVFPAVHVPGTSPYPARAVIPLWLWYLTPSLRTLTLAVWDLSEQAHNSYLYRLQIIRTDSSAYDRHPIL